jgi:hypothetical protein
VHSEQKWWRINWVQRRTGLGREVDSIGPIYKTVGMAFGGQQILRRSFRRRLFYILRFIRRVMQGTLLPFSVKEGGFKLTSFYVFKVEG